jgi:hypothetical protein
MFLGQAMEVTHFLKLGNGDIEDLVAGVLDTVELDWLVLELLNETSFAQSGMAIDTCGEAFIASFLSQAVQVKAIEKELVHFGVGYPSAVATLVREFLLVRIRALLGHLFSPSLPSLYSLSHVFLNSSSRKTLGSSFS